MKPHQRLRRLPWFLACLPLLAAAAGPGAPAADPALLQRGEELVMAKCFVCHGPRGENSTPLFPRLAAQHSEYVARQLADFKSGRRRSNTMQPMVDDLKPEDFRALGAFFEAQPAHGHPVDEAELARAGRKLYEQGNRANGVMRCVACHGEQGEGDATLPRLAGQHAKYIETQLRAFGGRERTNDNEVMHRIASKLSEQEVKALASYLSGLH